ncbi:hypothetical protein AWZ03_012923 [Drosophila navojoa]|uniref:Uncharacterized protein n=1 Tax=Drosophila navojoa TaxID=7232 RepID=A0A484AYG8_DRONA|nr:hypothetical protein AWZ03_012923 [Drosophila navojoa]
MCCAYRNSPAAQQPDGQIVAARRWERGEGRGRHQRLLARAATCRTVLHVPQRRRRCPICRVTDANANADADVGVA